MELVHNGLQYRIYQSASSSLTLIPQYDPINGIVFWFIDNPTPTTQYVVIYRGAILSGIRINPYPFGNAFWVDYMGVINGQRVSTPITSLNSIPPYSIGMINNHIPAFVFQVPPRTVLAVPEGGFQGLQELFYTLIPVVPDRLRFYVIFWSPNHYLAYVQQTQYNVKPVSFPYVGWLYNFNTQYSLSPAFHDLVIPLW